MRAQLEKARELAEDGRLSDARLLAETVCREAPDNGEAWQLLGNIHAHQGSFSQAEHCLQKTVSLQPDNAAGHYQLAAALKVQHKTHGAIHHYRQCLQLQPGLVQVHNDLGVILQEESRLEEAADCYTMAIKIDPGYAMAHYNLGTIRRQQEHYGEARDCYLEALKYRPDFAAAYNAAGLACQSLEDFETAIAFFRKAAELDPELQEAYHNLGSCLLRARRCTEALSVLDKAVNLRPGFPETWYLLGKAHRANRDLERAMACFEKASSLRAGYEDAIVGQVEILGLQGKFEAAYALVAPLAEQGCQHPDIALGYAALGKRFGRTREALALLERVSAGDTLHDRERRQIEFSMGKLYDSLGNYDQAFLHYQRGNRLKDAQFDNEQNTAFVDKLLTVFSRERMPYLPRSSVPTDLPVFVLGMPRSGTTLVEQILSSHPEIYGAGELTTMTDLTISLPDSLGTDISYPDCIPLITPDQADRLAQAYLQRLPAECHDSKRVIDKMPHNFLHLGLIELLFPDARVIHCQRDPRDNCLSMFFCDFASEHDYAYDLATLGKYYLEYQRLMEHWKTVLSLDIHTIQYETLVADQLATSRALIEFCGLEWDERCLDFHQHDGIVFTASYEQVRNPVYSRSVGRWRHYRKHISPLIDELGDSPAI